MSDDEDDGIAELLDGEGDSPALSDAVGVFDAEKLNKNYALIMIGGRAAILQENFDDGVPGNDRIQFITVEAFNQWHANDRIVLDQKQISVSILWMRSSQRRQYKGIVFIPGETPINYYNLWRGWSYQPSEEGSCSTFLDHLRTNIANGNEDHYKYILGWAANIIQRPEERLGISLVLRGDMGSGKTVFGQVMGALMKSHYALVDDPRYITGNFNAHMQSLLLLQADEGFWAGDKTAESRLKGLVTSPIQMLEMKGRDPIQISNYIRLLVTSNSSWIVPAGKDERRFAVFDVANHSKQNRTYFKQVFQELENGGYQKLMNILLEFDLDSINLASIPKTDALLDQKMASMTPVERWWFKCLQEGQLGDDLFWPTHVVCAALWSRYVNYSERLGTHHHLDQPRFGVELKRIDPEIVKRRRRKDGNLDNVYLIPSIKDCRLRFSERLNAEIIWDAEYMPYEPPQGEDID